jgi:hypothetical protein
MSRPRLRRLCFDIESDRYWSLAWGWGTVQERRSIIRDWKVRFDAGVVYDASTGRYRAFDAGRLDEFVTYLATADELVSFNGRRWDLLLLENLSGEGKIREALWSKPHHDLHGWKGRYEKDDLAKTVLPPAAHALDDKWTKWHPKLLGKEPTRFDRPDKVKKGWMDVSLTCEVFRLYLAEGDGTCSYRPDNET